MKIENEVMFIGKNVLNGYPHSAFSAPALLIPFPILSK